MIIKFENKTPQIAAGAYIDPSAKIIGEVEIGKDASVWYNTVVRGDIHYVKIGQRTNIQDLCMIHVTDHTSPTNIGNDVTVGHSAVLHGCTVRDLCVIGIGSIILDDAQIGPQCFVAAGSLVTPRFKATPGTMIMGSPAKTVRPLRADELQLMEEMKEKYLTYVKRYKSGMEIVSHGD